MTHEKKIKPLGVVLKEKGLITDEYVGYALQEQKITQEKIGEILERLGFVTENDIVVALSEQSGVPYIDVDTILPEEGKVCPRILRLSPFHSLPIRLLSPELRTFSLNHLLLNFKNGGWLRSGKEKSRMQP